MSPTLLKKLGISSEHEAAELELDLGVRFNDFTPEDSDTWNRQNLYLYQYARTRTFTHAAGAAGVSLRKARTWQAENTLGFNHRLQIAVLEYTEEIEVLLIERARQPNSPPSLLTMLLRAHLPEKYGAARRESHTRDNPEDHDDDPKQELSPDDIASLNDIRRDIQQLKHFAGISEPPNLSPGGGETQRGGFHTPVEPGSIPTNDLPQTPVDAALKPAPNTSPTEKDPSYSDLSPAGGETQRGGFHTPVDAALKPAPNTSPTEKDPSYSDLSPTGGETQRGGSHTPVGAALKPAPTLNRRQRRQLQRQQSKQKTRQPASHQARAPN